MFPGREGAPTCEDTAVCEDVPVCEGAPVCEDAPIRKDPPAGTVDVLVFDAPLDEPVGGGLEDVGTRGSRFLSLASKSFLLCASSAARALATFVACSTSSLRRSAKHKSVNLHARIAITGTYTLISMVVEGIKPICLPNLPRSGRRVSRRRCHLPRCRNRLLSTSCYASDTR